jgi:methionyl-tRNA formyltransferase
MNKLKTIFMGTPEFCLPTLEMLRTHPDIDLVHVVSMPDRKSGRGQKLQSPPVIEFAQKNKVPYFQTAQINREEDFLQSLEKLEIDVIIVLAFAQFLGKRVLNLPNKACYNIHTSLLPKYRGAAPIQYALLKGDRETGVTIQEMVKKMDAGDIVHQDRLTIHPRETGQSLFNRLSYQSALSGYDFLEKLNQDAITKTPQVQEGLSFAPVLTKDMGQLNFKENSAIEIARQVRALYPWPGTYTFLNHKRLKVQNTQMSHKNLQAGELLIDRDGKIHVGTQNGTLRLSEIQLEGKKPGLDVDFFKSVPKKDLYRITEKEPL